MARKSRKTIDDPVVAKSQLAKTAIYIRLSVEDNKKRGNSIENQSDILNDFVRNHPDLELFDTYCEMKTTRLIQFNYSSRSFVLGAFLGCINFAAERKMHPNAPNPKPRKTPPEKLCLKRGF